jgi:hypothetical protein
MKWYPKNLHDLTLLLLKIWKYSYFAFPTYILKKIDNQPSTQVFLKKCNSQFVGLIFILGDVILYIKYHEIDYSVKSSSSLLQLVSTCIHNITIIIIFYIKREKLATLLINIFSVENYASELIRNFNCDDVTRYFIKYTVAKLCTILIIVFGDFMYIVKNTEDVIFHACFYVQWLLYSISEMSLIFFLLILKKFYIEFNNYLNNGNVPLERAFHINSLLRKLAKRINKLLVVILLSKFVADSISATNAIFFGINVIVARGKGFVSYSFMFVSISVWFITIFFNDLIITGYFVKISEEVI